MQLIVKAPPAIPSTAPSMNAPALDHLDECFLARNNSTSPKITSTVADKSRKNHVVGNHLAKILERIIMQKPMMDKAAPEKILKAFVAIFLELIADIPDQRARLVKKLGFGAFEEKGERRRENPQRLRILAPNLVKHIFSYKDSRTRSVKQ